MGAGQSDYPSDPHLEGGRAPIFDSKYVNKSIRGGGKYVTGSYDEIQNIMGGVFALNSCTGGGHRSGLLLGHYRNTSGGCGDMDVRGGKPGDKDIHYDKDEEQKVQFLTKLRAYKHSPSNTLRMALISKIADVMSKSGVQGINKDSDPEVVINTLKKQLPNPLKGTTIVSDGSVTARLVKALVELINDTFGRGKKLIDTSIPVSRQLVEVSDWVYSLSMGFQYEFKFVHEQLQTVLGNLRLVNDVSSELVTKEMNRLKSESLSPKAKADLTETITLYEGVQREVSRQINLLENILHTSEDATTHITTSASNTAEIYDRITNLSVTDNSSSFGDRLAYLLTLMGDLTYIAALTNEALLATGIKLEEYSKTKNIRDLTELIDKKIKGISDKTPEEAVKFFANVSILMKYFNPELSSKIAELRDSAKKVQAKGDYTNLYTGGTHSEYSGGRTDELELAYGVNKPRKVTEIDKKIEEQKRAKIAILKSYIEAMSKAINKFVKALDTAVDVLKDITIHNLTHLVEFKRFIEYIKDIKTRYKFLAIVGYYEEPSASSDYQRYRSYLDKAIQLASNIAGIGGEYAPLSDSYKKISEALSEIRSTIELYTEGVKLVFEILPNSELDKLLPHALPATVSMADTVTKFQYFLYIMNMKSSIAKSSKETEEYGGKYVDLLATAIGVKRRMIEEEVKEHYAELQKCINEHEDHIEDNFLNDIREYFKCRGILLPFKDMKTQILQRPDAYPIEFRNILNSKIYKNTQDVVKATDAITATYATIDSPAVIADDAPARAARAPPGAPALPSLPAHAAPARPTEEKTATTIEEPYVSDIGINAKTFNNTARPEESTELKRNLINLYDEISGIIDYFNSPYFKNLSSVNQTLAVDITIRIANMRHDLSQVEYAIDQILANTHAGYALIRDTYQNSRQAIDDIKENARNLAGDAEIAYSDIEKGVLSGKLNMSYMPAVAVAPRLDITAPGGPPPLGGPLGGPPGGPPIATTAPVRGRTGGRGAIGGVSRGIGRGRGSGSSILHGGVVVVGDRINRPVELANIDVIHHVRKMIRNIKDIDEYKDHLKEEYKAKMRFYKALEALEHTLKNMTLDTMDGMSNIKHILDVLGDMKIHTQWGTESTGNLLVNVFESMPMGIKLYNTVSAFAMEPVARNIWRIAPVGEDNDNGVVNQSNDEVYVSEHYPQTYHTPITFATIRNLQNTANLFDYTFGNALGSVLYSDIKLKPSKDQKHYYTVLLDKIKAMRTKLRSLSVFNKFSKHLVAGVQNTNNDNPILCTQSAVYGKASGVLEPSRRNITMDYIDSYYENFQALKNIFYIFSTINVQKKTDRSAFLTPNQIYIAFVHYLKQSALTRKPTFNGIAGKTTVATKYFGLILPAYYGPCNYSPYYDAKAMQQLTIGPSNISAEHNKLYPYTDFDNEVRGTVRDIVYDNRTAQFPADGDAIGTAPTHLSEYDHIRLHLPRSWAPVDDDTSRSFLKPELYKGHYPVEDNFQDSTTRYQRRYVDANRNNMVNAKIASSNVPGSDLAKLKLDNRALRGGVGPGELEKTFVINNYAQSASIISSHAISKLHITNKTQLHREYVSPYYVEDKFFVHAMKAITGRILTVLSLSHAIDRKTSPKTIYDIRSIVGGSRSSSSNPLIEMDGSIIPEAIPLDSSDGGSYIPLEVTAPPEIIDDAIPLYFYLPRYVEFYKSIFKNSPTELQGDEESELISTLHDFSGVYQNLIKFIFRSTGMTDYTEVEINAIIREINKIYAHYSSSKSPTQDAVRGLINEVNRRYGLIKIKHLRALNYNSLDDPRFDVNRNKSIRDDDDTIIERLQLPSRDKNYGDDEEDIEMIDLVNAPSDSINKLPTLAATTRDSIKRDYLDITDRHLDGTERTDDFKLLELVTQFRNKVDSHFIKCIEYGKGDDHVPDVPVEYTNMLEHYKDKIVNKKDNPPKVPLVSSLVRMSTSSNVEKDSMMYLMFEDVVVNTINVLQKLVIMLDEIYYRAYTWTVGGMYDMIMKLKNNRDFSNMSKLTEMANSHGYRDDEGILRYIIKQVLESMQVILDTVFDSTHISKFGGILSGDSINMVLHTLLIDVDNDAAVTLLLEQSNVLKEFDRCKSYSESDSALNLLLTIIDTAYDAVEWGSIISYFFQLLFSLKNTGDDLVTVKFDGSAKTVLIDSTGIAKYTKDLIKIVRNQIDTFRPRLPAEYIRKYDNNEQSIDADGVNINELETPAERDVDQMCNINYIEAILNEYFVYSVNYSNSTSPSRDISKFNKLSEIVKHTFSRRLFGNINARLLSDNQLQVGHHFKKHLVAVPILSEIFYDIRTYHRLTTVPVASEKIFTIVSSKTDMDGDSVRDKVIINIGDNRGNIFADINYGIKMIIDQFFDMSVYRIYEPFLRNLVSGKLAIAVKDPFRYAYPDICNEDAVSVNGVHPTMFGLPLPAENSIITFSNAILLRTILNTVNIRTQQPTHVVSSLAEIPNATKDMFKCKIPVFVKYFETIYKKIVYYRGIIDGFINDSESFRASVPIAAHITYNTSVESAQDARPIAYGVNLNTLAQTLTDISHYSTGQLNADLNIGRMIEKIIMSSGISRDINDILITKTTLNNTSLEYTYSIKSIHSLFDQSSSSNEPEIRIYMLRLLDSYRETCQNIINALQSIYNELNDSPLYLQLYPTFNEEYEKAAGKHPMAFIMYSSVFINAKRSDAVNNLDQLYGNTITKLQNAFKCIYYLNSIGYKDALVSNLFTTLTYYNSIVNDSYKIDKSTYTELLKRVFVFLNYINTYQGFIRPTTGVFKSVSNNKIPFLTNRVIGSIGRKETIGGAPVDNKQDVKPRFNTTFANYEIMDPASYYPVSSNHGFVDGQSVYDRSVQKLSLMTTNPNDFLRLLKVKDISAATTAIKYVNDMVDNSVIISIGDSDKLNSSYLMIGTPYVVNAATANPEKINVVTMTAPGLCIYGSLMFAALALSNPLLDVAKILNNYNQILSEIVARPDIAYPNVSDAMIHHNKNAVTLFPPYIINDGTGLKIDTENKRVPIQLLNGFIDNLSKMYPYMKTVLNTYRNQSMGLFDYVNTNARSIQTYTLPNKMILSLKTIEGCINRDLLLDILGAKMTYSTLKNVYDSYRNRQIIRGFSISHVSYDIEKINAIDAAQNDKSLLGDALYYSLFRMKDANRDMLFQIDGLNIRSTRGGSGHYDGGASSMYEEDVIDYNPSTKTSLYTGNMANIIAAKPAASKLNNSFIPVNLSTTAQPTRTATPPVAAHDYKRTFKEKILNFIDKYANTMRAAYMSVINRADVAINDDEFRRTIRELNNSYGKQISIDYINVMCSFIDAIRSSPTTANAFIREGDKPNIHLIHFISIMYSYITGYGYFTNSSAAASPAAITINQWPIPLRRSIIYNTFHGVILARLGALRDNIISSMDDYDTTNANWPNYRYINTHVVMAALRYAMEFSGLTPGKNISAERVGEITRAIRTFVENYEDPTLHGSPIGVAPFEVHGNNIHAADLTQAVENFAKYYFDTTTVDISPRLTVQDEYSQSYINTLLVINKKRLENLIFKIYTHQLLYKFTGEPCICTRDEDDPTATDFAAAVYSISIGLLNNMMIIPVPNFCVNAYANLLKYIIDYLETIFALSVSLQDITIKYYTQMNIVSKSREPSVQYVNDGMVKINESALKIYNKLKTKFREMMSIQYHVERLLMKTIDNAKLTEYGLTNDTLPFNSALFDSCFNYSTVLYDERAFAPFLKGKKERIQIARYDDTMGHTEFLFPGIFDEDDEDKFYQQEGDFIVFEKDGMPQVECGVNTNNFTVSPKHLTSVMSFNPLIGSPNNVDKYYDKPHEVFHRIGVTRFEDIYGSVQDDSIKDAISNCKIQVSEDLEYAVKLPPTGEVQICPFIICLSGIFTSTHRRYSGVFDSKYADAAATINAAAPILRDDIGGERFFAIMNNFYKPYKEPKTMLYGAVGAAPPRDNDKYARPVIGLYTTSGSTTGLSTLHNHLCCLPADQITYDTSFYKIMKNMEVPDVDIGDTVYHDNMCTIILKIITTSFKTITDTNIPSWVDVGQLIHKTEIRNPYINSLVYSDEFNIPIEESVKTGLIELNIKRIPTTQKRPDTFVWPNFPYSLYEISGSSILNGCSSGVIDRVLENITVIGSNASSMNDTRRKNPIYGGVLPSSTNVNYSITYGVTHEELNKRDYTPWSLLSATLDNQPVTINRKWNTKHPEVKRLIGKLLSQDVSSAYLFMDVRNAPIDRSSTNLEQDAWGFLGIKGGKRGQHMITGGIPRGRILTGGVYEAVIPSIYRLLDDGNIDPAYLNTLYNNYSLPILRNKYIDKTLYRNGYMFVSDGDFAYSNKDLILSELLFIIHHVIELSKVVRSIILHINGMALSDKCATNLKFQFVRCVLMYNYCNDIENLAYSDDLVDRVDVLTKLLVSCCERITDNDGIYRLYILIMINSIINSKIDISLFSPSRVAVLKVTADYYNMAVCYMHAIATQYARDNAYDPTATANPVHIATSTDLSNHFIKLEEMYVYKFPAKSTSREIDLSSFANYPLNSSIVDRNFSLYVALIRLGVNSPGAIADNSFITELENKRLYDYMTSWPPAVGEIGVDLDRAIVFNVAGMQGSDMIKIYATFPEDAHKSVTQWFIKLIDGFRPTIGDQNTLMINAENAYTAGLGVAHAVESDLHDKIITAVTDKYSDYYTIIHNLRTDTAIDDSLNQFTQLINDVKPQYNKLYVINGISQRLSAFQDIEIRELVIIYRILFEYADEAKINMNTKPRSNYSINMNDLEEIVKKYERIPILGSAHKIFRQMMSSLINIIKSSFGLLGAGATISGITCNVIDIYRYIYYICSIKMNAVRSFIYFEKGVNMPPLIEDGALTDFENLVNASIAYKTRLDNNDDIVNKIIKGIGLDNIKQLMKYAEFIKYGKNVTELNNIRYGIYNGDAPHAEHMSGGVVFDNKNELLKLLSSEYYSRQPSITGVELKIHYGDQLLMYIQSKSESYFKGQISNINGAVDELVNYISGRVSGVFTQFELLIRYITQLSTIERAFQEQFSNANVNTIMGRATAEKNRVTGIRDAAALERDRLKGLLDVAEDAYDTYVALFPNRIPPADATTQAYIDAVDSADADLQKHINDVLKPAQDNVTKSERAEIKWRWIRYVNYLVVNPADHLTIEQLSGIVNAGFDEVIRDYANKTLEGSASHLLPAAAVAPTDDQIKTAINNFHDTCMEMEKMYQFIPEGSYLHEWYLHIFNLISNYRSNFTGFAEKHKNRAFLVPLIEENFGNYYENSFAYQLIFPNPNRLTFTEILNRINTSALPDFAKIGEARTHPEQVLKKLVDGDHAWVDIFGRGKNQIPTYIDAYVDIMEYHKHLRDSGEITGGVIRGHEVPYALTGYTFGKTLGTIPLKHIERSDGTHLYLVENSKTIRSRLGYTAEAATNTKPICPLMSRILDDIRVSIANAGFLPKYSAPTIHAPTAATGVHTFSSSSIDSGLIESVLLTIATNGKIERMRAANMIPQLGSTNQQNATAYNISIKSPTEVKSGVQSTLPSETDVYVELQRLLLNEEDKAKKQAYIMEISNSPFNIMYYKEVIKFIFASVYSMPLRRDISRSRTDEYIKTSMGVSNNKYSTSVILALKGVIGEYSDYMDNYKPKYVTPSTDVSKITRGLRHKMYGTTNFPYLFVNADVFTSYDTNPREWIGPSLHFKAKMHAYTTYLTSIYSNISVAEITICRSIYMMNGRLLKQINGEDVSALAKPRANYSDGKDAMYGEYLNKYQATDAGESIFIPVSDLSRYSQMLHQNNSVLADRINDPYYIGSKDSATHKMFGEIYGGSSARRNKTPIYDSIEGGSLLKLSPETIFELISSHNPLEKLKYLVVSKIDKDGSDKVNEKEMQIVKAILEFNLYPVNVHAIQRFIPFANIYNYSYTFDRYVENFTGIGVGEIDKYTPSYNDIMQMQNGYFNYNIDNRVCYKAFATLLSKPLAPIDTLYFGSPMHGVLIAVSPLGRLFRGTDELGIGRAKFVADQLLNKVYLGSMITGCNLVDESFKQKKYTNNRSNYMIDYDDDIDDDNMPYRSRFIKRDTKGSKLYMITHLESPDYDDDSSLIYKSLYYFDAHKKDIDMITLQYDPDQDPGGDIPRTGDSDWSTLLSSSEVMDIHREGYERFNTQISRMSLFITSLQRFLRLQISQMFMKPIKQIEQSVRGFGSDLTETTVYDSPFMRSLNHKLL